MKANALIAFALIIIWSVQGCEVQTSLGNLGREKACVFLEGHIIFLLDLCCLVVIYLSTNMPRPNFCGGMHADYTALGFAFITKERGSSFIVLFYLSDCPSVAQGSWGDRLFSFSSCLVEQMTF